MKIEESYTGFKVFFKDKEILNHTKNEPCLFAGKGRAIYDMHKGNFEIKDDLIEKVGLKDFKITDGKKQIKIQFSFNGLCIFEMMLEEVENRVIINFVKIPENVNRIWFRINAKEEEHVYGCGEQFSYFDLRGKSFPLWVSELGIGRNKNTYTTFMADKYDKAGGDYYTTYYPQPTFVSSEKYFCHVNDSCYMNFDFSNRDFHELEIWGIPEKITIGVANNYLEVLENLTALLGRQPEMPDWIYRGVILGVQGGTQIAINKYRNAIKKGVKVNAIWAQDWVGQKNTTFGKRLHWNWVCDSRRYPELDIEIKKLNKNGDRFLGYINPYLLKECSLFKEASRKGFMVKNQEGHDYLVDVGEFDVGIVDLTHPKAFNWYKEIIKKNMIEFGFSGWMADFGEYLPTDAVLYNKMNAEKAHNLWPILWAKLNRATIEETGKLGEILYFMRSGYSGAGRYNTMTFSGDQNVDWSLDDGLASIIPAALSLGMSGMGLHHSDIGGYTTIYDMKRSKELMMRWIEMAAFTPMMRTHEGNRPEDNWQFDSDDETLLFLAKMSIIFTKLAPYIKAAVKENSNKGIPVMRPLFIHYENDKKTYDLKYEYLLGRDLLVAPVYESGKDRWKVYLPEDNWVHLWDDTKYNGGEIEVEAPIGKMPVFYRESSKYVDLFKEIAKYSMLSKENNEVYN